MFLHFSFFIYFQGELEQLTVVDESFGGVSEQCSPNKVPFLLEEIAEKKGVNISFGHENPSSELENSKRFP